MAYNVLYLTKPIPGEGEVFRDYVDTRLAREHPEWRPLLLLPWYEHEIEQTPASATPTDEYFSEGRVPDQLAGLEAQERANDALNKKKRGDTPIKIYTDHSQIVKNLKNVQYELVDNWKEADVLWLMEHFHEFRYGRHFLKESTKMSWITVARQA